MEKDLKVKVKLAAGALALVSVAPPAALYYDSVKANPHNGEGQKQAVFPVVKGQEPSALLENIAVYTVAAHKDCPKTDYSEPISVFLGEKWLGQYCLSRSIDEVFRNTLGMMTIRF